MKTKKLYLILIAGIIIAISYFLLHLSLGSKNLKFVKNLVPSSTKQTIKKYIFPYNHIKELETELNYKRFYSPELEFGENNEDIIFENTRTISFFDEKNVELKKYTNLAQLKRGINNYYPGSAYLDVYEDKLFILSSTGILGYANEEEKLFIEMKKIKSNLNSFLNSSHFDRNKGFSFRDIKVFRDKIFVSFNDEIKKNCWNTSLLQAKLNFDSLDFTFLFRSKECVNSKKNEDNQFNVTQSGGRIFQQDNSNLLFTIGDYRARKFAQKDNSVLGKIIQIDHTNGKYKIISKGHRNQQGLFILPNKNFAISTEHGPHGGDEINLINLNSDQKIQNFGWPVSSYGKHYSSTLKADKDSYKKYPLHKSHKDYGFIEPLKYFTPSVGISEVIGLNNNKFIASSMKDRSIYFFKLDIENKISSLKRVEIGERIRDLAISKDKLYFYLEDTASLGVLTF